MTTDAQPTPQTEPAAPARAAEAETPVVSPARTPINRLRGLVAVPAWEMAIWAAITLAALFTRFWNLGARVMSHDESLHVYYSWLLSKGGEYAHNPMMHGPFLFEITAIFERIFGTNDVTSRLAPALIGVFIVIGVPLLLRPWLGKGGALVAAALLLVSPYLLFYSRYNRHDIQVIAWVLLAAAAILGYLSKRTEGKLVLLAVALALMLSTMEISFIYLATFASFLAIRVLARYGLNWKPIRESAEWDLLVVLVTLGAFFSAPIALLVLNPIWKAVSGQPYVDMSVLSSYGIEWASGPSGLRLWYLMAFFWVAAAAIGLWWNFQRWAVLAGTFLAITIPLFTTFFTNWPGIGTGFIGSLGYWLSQHSVQRGSQPEYYYLIVFPLYEYLPLVGGIAALAWLAFRRKHIAEPVRTYVLLAGWWALCIITGLSIAGEKMPWLSTHITVPFILLTAWLVPEIFRGAWRRLDAETHSFSWPALLLGLPLVLLFALTTRTSYMVNYVNYDYTTEFIGYAHGAPGVKWAMDAVDQAAKKLGLGNQMVVAYDSQVSWPMTWYLRDYPGFFGKQPNRGALENAPVIVAGSENWQKVESYVGTNYKRYEVVRIWWPMEGYKDLTWERIRGALTDPEMRRAVWNIIWARDYSLYASLTGENLNPPANWSLEDRMRVYIRSDVAAQLAGLELQAYLLPDLAPRVNAYAGKEIRLEPKTVLAPGDWNRPRSLAIAPDGAVYLLDSGNGRVVKLDQQGSVQFTWGSRTPDGQVPPGPGTFNEPWGVAVAQDGSVYVADTWNHRIQKFDSSGRFLLEWGTGGLSSEGSDRFWGPRGLAIGPDGNVYVTDTGNRRVAVFNAQGVFQFEFAQDGDAQLDEPVGIAIGPGSGAESQVYVADTWNRRVAVFTLQGQYLRSWPIAGWESASVDNKPFLAVDQQGRVYLTDPEAYRVMVFAQDGTAQSVFGTFGEASAELNLPTGIGVDPSSQLWVVDSGNNRVVIYPKP